MTDSRDTLRTSVVSKEWAAVRGDKIVEKAPTRERLEWALWETGRNPDDYEIVALPKLYRSVVL